VKTRKCVPIIFLEINSPSVLVQRAAAKRITLSLHFFLLATKFSSVLVFSLRFFLLLSIKDKEKKNECRMERGKHFFFCGRSKSLTQEISRTTARLGISVFCFLLWLSKEIGINAYILGAVALPNRTDKLVLHCLLSCATESTVYRIQAWHYGLCIFGLCYHGV